MSRSSSAPTDPRRAGAGLGVPGRSALAAWRRARRARRRRLVTVALLALSGIAVAAAWAWAQTANVAASLSDWPLLGVAGLLGAVALALRPRSDPERWARGAAGEVATAELLDRLSAPRWLVLHDLRLPGSRANVDHLVIGPTGVWVVDSKAYRARVEGRWRQVLVGGVPLSTAAVRWEAEVVSERLGARARPVIALHGKGLSRRGRSCDGVRVLPAARLVKRLRRGRYLRPSLDAVTVKHLGARAEAQFGWAPSRGHPSTSG